MVPELLLGASDYFINDKDTWNICMEMLLNVNNNYFDQITNFETYFCESQPRAFKEDS